MLPFSVMQDFLNERNEPRGTSKVASTLNLCSSGQRANNPSLLPTHARLISHFAKPSNSPDPPAHPAQVVIASHQPPSVVPPAPTAKDQHTLSNLSLTNSYQAAIASCSYKCGDSVLSHSQDGRTTSTHQNGETQMCERCWRKYSSSGALRKLRTFEIYINKYNITILNARATFI